MFDIVSIWYRRYFSHPQAVLLVLLLVISTLVLLYFGHMLAPVLAAVVVAYMLEVTVNHLERWGLPRFIAVSIVFSVFLTVLVFVLLGLMPILSRQITNFIQELPRMISEGRELLLRLPELYPNMITTIQVDNVIGAIQNGINSMGQSVLSISLASIPAFVTLLIYLILGPVLVFFFLKDKTQLIVWCTSFLPTERGVIERVWSEMDVQIGNYIRGKVYEILIVGSVTYVTFSFLGLSYAPLLAVVVGLSVIVPYLGAAVVTFPVALAGYLQFGWGNDFVWVMVAYAILQALDGNLLVPLLFSDVVNLHPVAIIIAVLVFGGLWGFWGVFFAIPLATLVKSLLNAWPRASDLMSSPPPE
ncbi:MAG TPA: AI-2E family transporter [Gammaproteobacteria bacterium]|nr:AI-2E family transporter [Gammaproteobacteria bacterium]|tara:strand:+ start:876 stop:1952 length:1077 start_codon:yes stop_codon:yes gene_type:complete